MSTEWVECTTTDGLKTWIHLRNLTRIEMGTDGVTLIRFTDGAYIRVKEAPQDILSRTGASVAHEQETE
jgi:hypothetical protein